MCGNVARVIGDSACSNWIRPLSFFGLENGCADIVAPTEFVRDWVLSYYSNVLLDALREEGDVSNVTVSVKSMGGSACADSDAVNSIAPNVAAVSVTNALDKDLVSRAEKATDGAYVAVSDSQRTFENFVVGKSNEFAYAAALSVAEASRPSHNPFFIHGPVGLGKTHLMLAIKERFLKLYPNRKALYLSAEKFMYSFIHALRHEKDTFSFKSRLRDLDMLLIDDVQFIIGKGSTQEEFFHTFNALVEQNKQIILSADQSPSDLSGLEERVRSRLGWGLVADIHATDYELRLGILQMKGESLDVDVSSQVLEFLASHITTNVRELEGALNRLMAHSRLTGIGITLDLARVLLKDLLRNCNRVVSIAEIQKQIALHYCVKISDLNSARRTKIVARARQVAMFLAKEMTASSFPEIGRNFGGRDHTTALYAVRTIEKLSNEDESMREDLRILRGRLEG